MANIPSHFSNSSSELVPYDGSPVTYRVSVYGVCVVDSKILLVQSNQERFFDAPGGGVEIGEDFADALRREGREEAGWELRPIKLLLVKFDWLYHSSEKRFYRTLMHYYLVEGHKLAEKPTDPRMVFSELVPVPEALQMPLYNHVREAIEVYLSQT